jgi:hypothetical protein
MLPTRLIVAYGAEEVGQRLLRRRLIDSQHGCWLWTGAKQSSGYGVITLRKGGPRTQYTVHRLAAMLWGDVAADCQDDILHTCDRRECFNPDHLYQGNDVQNMRDALERGRHRFEAHCGERNGQAKLTPEVVQVARLAHDGGARVALLSRVFGVTYSAMWQVVRGKTWKHTEGRAA